MKTTVYRLTRQVAAGAALAALTLASLGGSAAAAEDLVGSINADASGSLLIHKHVHGTQSQVGVPDGSVSVKAQGVAGVVFTAYQVTNLDLRDPGSWNGLQDLNVPGTACGNDYKTPALRLPSGQAATFGQGRASAATDAAGDTTIGGLPVAAYLVCETALPAGVVQHAAPFLVTVPHPSGQQGGWLYDVNVYPKNRLFDAPTKTVRVVGNGLSSNGQLVYEITQTVPALDPGYSFSEFILVDNMGEGQSTDPVVVSKLVLGETELVKDKHYVVTTQDGHIYIAMNKTGLAMLKDHQGEKVVATLMARADRVGSISNSAQTYVSSRPGGNPPGNPPTTPPPGERPQPTKKVESSWGDVLIVKEDRASTKRLSGATFEVYNAKAPYGGTCTTEMEGAPITVGGETTFTTDGGVVRIPGLFIDKGEAAWDSATGKYAQTSWEHGNEYRCYVLREIKAPKGYRLPLDSEALTAVKVVPGATTEVEDVTVKNDKKHHELLAKTGLLGQIIMMTGGVALLSMAGGLFLVSRRREQEQA